MQIGFILAFLVGLSGLHQIDSTLSPVPENVKINSHVSYLDGTVFSNLEVVEYVNIQDGSIRLDIDDQNVTNGTSVSFFRLMSNNDREDRLMDSTVIEYNPATGKCGLAHIQEWPLKHFSRLLSELSTPKNRLMGINEGIPNRTFLGPASLLRLVHYNSDSFKLFSKTRDELGDRNELHFSLRLNDWEKSGKQVVRILVTVSASTLNKEHHTYDLGQTLLSQVDNTNHLSRITLAILDERNKQDSASLNKHASPEFEDELFLSRNKLVEQLTVIYKLVQERSLSRHTSLESLARDIEYPFMMPVGLSCGSFSNNRHFYVSPTQFSGEFEVDDHGDQFYLAYDEVSNHLRYDVLGKSKMIYSLNDLSVTYIADQVSGLDNSELKRPSGPGSSGSTTTSRFGESSHYYDRSHCAQASLIGEPGVSLTGSSPLYNRKRMESILGIGEGVQLAYLGQTRLSAKDRNGKSTSLEPITCQVFERDVAFEKLPALIQMHLRVRPSESNNLTLIYYFVDELNSRTKKSLFNEKLHPYQSMWLKRIELFSRTSFSKYVFSNARITFSKSSWSLETVGEDTRNRDTQLEHPVRSFDTLECWPERNLVGLEVVLKQQDPDEWKKKGLEFKDAKMPLKQVECFEETIINFLSRKLGFPRSRINHFAIEFPDNFESTLIRAKLTLPFAYLYRQKLIGWAESYKPLLLKKQVEIISRKYLFLPHECFLNLATRMGGRNKFNMVYCPNFGCGFLLVDPPELIEEEEEANNKSSYHPIDGPQEKPLQLGVYNELCSVHLVSKTVQQQGMVSPDHRVELVAGSLDGAAVSIESNQLDPERNEFKTTTYRARVSKVSVVSDKSLQSYEHDERIIADACFTPQTRPLNNLAQVMELPYGNGSLVIKQLPMDRHQSKVHCRKACILFEACETYSYDHVGRLCVLTNILPSLLRDPEITFESLMMHPNECAIYALDQLVRFQRTPAMILKSPADMILYHGEASNDSVILWTDLGECARFAHSSRWALPKQPDQRRLSSFGYMRLAKLCLLHGINRLEFLNQFSSARELLVDNSADLQKFTGDKSTQLSDLDAYGTYQENLEQFYKRQSGYYMDIIGNDIASTQQRTKLVGQDFERCLEACTNRQRDCVVFDSCLDVIDGKYTRDCYLFTIRSPYAFGTLERLYEQTQHAISVTPLKLNSSMPKEKLTADEENLYVKDRTRSEVVIKTSRQCQHYYLAGDNLRIKRLLAQDQKTLDAENPVDDKKAKSSLQPQEGSSEFFNSSWLPSLQLFAGLTIGCGIFITQAAITRQITARQIPQDVLGVSNQRIDKIRGALRPVTRGLQAEQRESQQLDCTEMVRIN